MNQQKEQTLYRAIPCHGPIYWNNDPGYYKLQQWTWFLLDYEPFTAIC